MTIILQNSTEHKRSKILECLNALGRPSTKPVITTANRGLVRGFLNGLGFQTHSYLNAGLEELQAAYWSINAVECPQVGNGLGFLPFLRAEAGGSISAEEAWENIDAILKRITDVNITVTFRDSAATVDMVREALAGLSAAVEPSTPVVVSVQAPASVPVPVAPKAQDAATALASAFASILAGASKPELDEGRVISLIRQHAQSTELRLVTNTGVTQVQTGVHHRKLPEVITYLNAGVNVFMVGAAGSGKTTIAEQAAKALGLPFYFNGALDSEYKLTGFIDAQGRIVSTAFRKAYEGGGVYLFDEVDASLPSALLAFNAALANGHSDFPDGCIKKHEKFLCVAAANTYGKGADRLYVGRNQLDAATLDRFAVINIDYDEKLERTLCGNEDWCDYVQGVRKAVFGLKIRHVVSPRASINGARLLAAGVSKDAVQESVVWKGLDEDSVVKIKQAMR